jgi:uncharacterized protein (DUF4415 family)
MMKKDDRAMEKIEGTEEAWESGTLGREIEFAAVCDEMTDKAIDDALGLQAISIRLPKDLIEAYKIIAAREGVGYQPLMRDILNRFIETEMKKVAWDFWREQDRARQEALNKQINEEASKEAKPKRQAKRAA